MTVPATCPYHFSLMHLAVGIHACILGYSSPAQQHCCVRHVLSSLAGLRRSAPCDDAGRPLVSATGGGGGGGLGSGFLLHLFTRPQCACLLSAQNTLASGVRRPHCPFAHTSRSARTLLLLLLLFQRMQGKPSALPCHASVLLTCSACSACRVHGDRDRFLFSQSVPFRRSSRRFAASTASVCVVCTPARPGSMLHNHHWRHAGTRVAPCPQHE